MSVRLMSSPPTSLRLTFPARNCTSRSRLLSQPLFWLSFTTWISQLSHCVATHHNGQSFLRLEETKNSSQVKPAESLTRKHIIQHDA